MATQQLAVQVTKADAIEAVTTDVIEGNIHDHPDWGVPCALIGVSPDLLVVLKRSGISETEMRHHGILDFSGHEPCLNVASLIFSRRELKRGGAEMGAMQSTVS